MPTFTPRLAVVVVAWSAISFVAPIAAQGTPAMATIYLKEGGVIQGQILNDNDPNGVRIKSAKSGTIFLLKTVWIDSIVKPHAAPVAPAAPVVAPAPKPAPARCRVGCRAVRSCRVRFCSVRSCSIRSRSVLCCSTSPSPSEAGRRGTGGGWTRAPPAAQASVPAAKPAKASKSTAEKKPAKFSHWYVGGGGSAPTGDMGSTIDIGYAGMLAYAAGVGKMTQLRLGGAGNYWSESSSDANFYDLTGTLDMLIGKRNSRLPGAIRPHWWRRRRTQHLTTPGFVGYARNPLYGARIGGGLNSSRIFIEVTYQKVWVAGTTSGYVPFVFGFRF